MNIHTHTQKPLINGYIFTILNDILQESYIYIYMYMHNGWLIMAIDCAWIKDTRYILIHGTIRVITKIHIQ